jgi:hypothetical protein
MVAPDNSQLFRVAPRTIAADSRYGVRYPNRAICVPVCAWPGPTVSRRPYLPMNGRVDYSEICTTVGSARATVWLVDLDRQFSGQVGVVSAYSISSNTRLISSDGR